MRVKILKKTGRLLPSAQIGFTLIELVIALSMSAIVLIAIFVIVSGSHEYIIDGRKKINLQQDFSLIDLVLAANIRQGVYGEQKIYATYSDFIGGQPPQSSGSCLKIKFPSGDWRAYYKDSTDFKIMKSDSSITNLVQGVLANLVFTEQTKSIQTALSLSQDGKTMSWNLVHTFRNEASGG